MALAARFSAVQPARAPPEFLLQDAPPNTSCSTTVEAAGRRYTRTHFYLRAEACPDNYHSVLAACRKQPVGGNVAVSGSPSGQQADADEGGKAEGDEIPPGLLAIGVTTYTGLFSDAELAAIEAAAGAGMGPWKRSLAFPASVVCQSGGYPCGCARAHDISRVQGPVHVADSAPLHAALRSPPHPR